MPLTPSDIEAIADAVMTWPGAVEVACWPFRALRSESVVILIGVGRIVATVAIDSPLPASQVHEALDLARSEAAHANPSKPLAVPSAN